MTRRDEQDGQILVLFVVALTLLLAMAAVAIDVSTAYAARRAYRTAGDASALAGAQELQQSLARSIGPAEYQKARDRAAEALGDQLGGAPACATSGTTASCTFTGRLTGTLKLEPMGEQTKRRLLGRLNAGGAPIEITAVNGNVVLRAR